MLPAKTGGQFELLVFGEHPKPVSDGSMVAAKTLAIPVDWRNRADTLLHAGNKPKDVVRVIMIEELDESKCIGDVDKLHRKVQNRLATLRQQKSGGSKFYLETLEELSMYFKNCTIRNANDFNNLGPNDMFVLDHQKTRDSKGILTEVAVDCLMCEVRLCLLPDCT